MIGGFIAVIGLILLPFIRNFISGDVPKDINIYILFFVYIVNTSGSYFYLHINHQY